MKADSAVRKDIESDVFRIHRMAADIEALYEAAGGVVDDSTEAIERFHASACEETMEALCRYREAIDGKRQVVKVELDRLHDLQTRLGNRDRWAEVLQFVVMSKLGTRRLDVGTFSITICQGREIVRAAENVDLSKLPESLVRTKTTVAPDLPAILAVLKDGTEVPGYSLTRSADFLRVK